jgi:hypothetical protein
VQPCEILIIEGTSGVGKSSLIDALLRRHVAARGSRKIRSVLHLAQSHTFGPLARAEDGGNLTVAQNLAHLDRIVSPLEWFHASVQEHDRPWAFAILDTLHLTHCVRPGTVAWPDVAPVDVRLAALGAKLLFLEAQPSTLWHRGIVPRLNEQFILEYARKFGRTNEEIHAYFVREQETLRALFDHSAMLKLSLNADESVETLTDHAYQFWTGELESAHSSPPQP